MSEVSESHAPSSVYASQQHLPPHHRRPSDAHTGRDSGIISGTGHMRGPSSGVGDPSDEIYPNESASAAGVNDKLPAAGNEYVSRYPEGTFAFKFKDPRNGRTHRFVGALDDLSAVRVTVIEKLGFGGSNVDSVRADPIGLCYIDDEGDQVLVASEDDLADAVSMAKRQGLDRVVLIISGLDGDQSPTHQQSRTPARSHLSVTSEATNAHSRNTTTVTALPADSDAASQARDLTKQRAADKSDGKPRGGPLDGIKPEYLQGAVIGLSIALISVLVVLKVR
ncbi:hypothetical protein THASP1DRAFT_33882 [Thamnocephalis sphaerospora]|uniref:PB1 domain-containing protein n=1 Tax=Thamnocephalis sphaerospora TaxID=78915 RepID=A0A4P9XFL6_9FUNG|nr:hypothetical protein THASP1DRAFT_33882 [Thamnocephalis sphaerospora]|eukprot:RKP04364.1 hypothetical protein THASP1DRAFT_33882 [Thamnocephalis sphaerospora]